MENITNVDKLRIREITEMQEAGNILVIDDNNVVQWINADEFDGSDTLQDILDNEPDDVSGNILNRGFKIRSFYLAGAKESLLEFFNSGNTRLFGSNLLEIKTDKASISLGENSNIFDDTATNSKGLEYKEDYSNNYSNRSLVDKEYVDNKIDNIQNHYAFFEQTYKQVPASEATLIDLEESFNTGIVNLDPTEKESIEVLQTGIYKITISFECNNSSSIILRFFGNNPPNDRAIRDATANFNTTSATFIIPLTVTDQIEVEAYSSDGGVFDVYLVIELLE